MCWLFCVSVLFFTFATSDSTLLDKLSKIKWHCADENCSVPIAEGYGLRLYNGDDPLKLNFNENDNFLILGKSNNKLDNYWLVQAGDRKGIVPVQFVKERKVIINRADQIVTELDLSSIINTIESERSTNKETIKPSSPSLVVDGTTLPSYEDESYSTEVVVEDDSEEIYDDPSIPQENPYFGGYSSPSPVKNDSPETDSNQTTNHPEVGEGFASDKVANINSFNVYTDEISSENSNTQTVSGIEANQDIANDKIETVPVGNISEHSNDQNFILSSTDTNQDLSNDNKVDSTVNNVTETVGIKTEESAEEKKFDNLKIVKSNLESEPANTQNIFTFTEPVPTIVPQQVNDDYSANFDQLGVTEKENSTAADPIPNIDAEINIPPTEIPKPESPAISAVTMDAKENPEVSQPDMNVINEIHSSSAEPILSSISETVTPTNEDAIVPQVVSGSVMGTISPPLKTDLPSEKEKVDEDIIVHTSDTVTSHVDPVPLSSGSLFPSYDQSIGTSKSSDTEVPPPTEPPSIQHYNPDSIKPVISPESLPGSVPASSSPGPDQAPQYFSPEIPSSYSYVSNNNEYSHNDTGDFESLPKETISNPAPEKPISSMVEDTAGSFNEPPPEYQQPSNQHFQEESVPKTLPTDKSVKESKDGEDDSRLPLQTDELADVIQEGDGWFSSISSIMGSFTEMFSKSDISGDRGEEVISSASEEIVTSTENNFSLRNDGEVKYCEKESCGQHQQSKDNVADDIESAGSAYVSAMFGIFPESQMSFSTFLCMVITSVVVLLFSLGYYYLENLKQDTSLVAKINAVSSELFFAQKELASIEEQYQLANENYRRLVSETSHNETAIEELRKELEESKAARGVLEDEIKRLEKEIESLVEEGDEMHRMLAESFSEEERTKSLLANISDLKSVLSDRLQEIVSLTEQLDKEKQEVELLTISLKKSEEKREATEDKLTKVLIDADSKTFAVTKEFEEKITTLERIIEERSLERTNFEKQLCELKGTCESLMVEKELAEKELKKAHGVSSGKALNEWLDAKNIRTELLTVQKEAEKLREALEEANNRGTLLEEKEKELLNEIEDLNNKYESAEKDKIEALTKLQVLSNYFKEKEIQLQEELGIKESQWLQKQSEDHTIYEQMRSLREENLSYKAQNDALKKEIIDQEASFKIQIANEEQKAQENWINLRHTERRLKEVQMEAAHLRSRLTALEANPDSLEDKHKSLEMNGDVSMGAASPPFMLYPPPDYIPPPPLVSPTRPPPLGRLSSPPLTPPAPLSPFEFYPPPPPSPPPPLRVHKPQPRESHRKQKDSQSSNHSSESTEKPIRRGKR